MVASRPIAIVFQTRASALVARASKSIDALLLSFFGPDEEPNLRRRALREDFTELTQLEERHRRIPSEVLLHAR